VIQLAGWLCTNRPSPDGPVCQTFNGEEKGPRKMCRACGGPRVATEGLGRDDLFRLCAMLLVERNTAYENVTAMQEKLGRYIECAQAAKAFMDTSGSLAFDALTVAVRRLEEDPATCAAMLRPYEPPRCPRCYGTGLVTAGGVSVDCPECVVDDGMACKNAAAKAAADRGFASLREDALAREREEEEARKKVLEACAARRETSGWDPAAPAGARKP
jgi:hypothetical protein